MELASAEYLKPASDLGDAEMHVTTTLNKDYFVIEIYDKVIKERPKLHNDKKVVNPDGSVVYEQYTALAPPRSMTAELFVERRFKHGWIRHSRQGALHPIYKVPITDYSVNLIQHAWKNPKVISELAKPFIHKIFMREFQADQNALRIARWKNDNNCVPTGPFFIQHDEWLYNAGLQQRDQPFIMNNYQKLFSYNACQVPAYGFLADPGLGKTLMMIRKLDHMISHSSSEQTFTIICCPKSVRQNWINEINTFSMYGENGQDKLHIITLKGGNDTARFCNFVDEMGNAGTKHVILVTGYESYVQTERLHVWEWDLCLFDESHNLSNPTTKRTKTFLTLRDSFANRCIATGTFFRNSPFDAFPQMEFLGDGYSGFSSYKAFKEFFAIYDNNSYGGPRHIVDFKNIPLLQEKLAKHTGIIRKEEALPHLPKKAWSIRACSLGKNQALAYKQLSEELIAVIESYGPDPDEVTVNNILTQMLRLAQITSGFVPVDAGTLTRFEENPKLDLLVNMLKGKPDDEDWEDWEPIFSDPNRKVLIWCCFKENLKMIHDRLKYEGYHGVMYHGSSDAKDSIIDEFNKNPKCRFFTGTAAAGGVGLNLVGFDWNNPTAYTTNTTDVFHYSKNFSAVNADQAENRAHRHTTRVPIQIWDLLVPGSIDEQIYKRVKGKKEMSLGIQDVKAIMQAILAPQVNGD